MSKKRGETVAEKPNWEKLLKPDEEPTLASLIAEEVATIRDDKEQRILTALTQPRARSRTFTAKPCTLCTALRGKDTNFTRVYATRDRVRYCKCTYCNNTWKDSDG